MTAAAILALLNSASWPAISTVAGGVLSVVFGGIGAAVRGAWTSAKPYFIGAALVALVVCAVSITVWIMHLEQRSVVAERLENREFELSVDMGCGDEKDVLVCFSKQKAAVAEAHENALKDQQEASAREQGVLKQKISKLQADLAESDAEIDSASDKDDGPLPKVLIDAWARERARRGAK